MQNYRFFRGYTLADPRFYEDLGVLPEGDLEREVNVVRSADVRVSRRGPWVMCKPTDVVTPPHGWKIHVSVVPAQARDALRVVLAEFAREPFHFKVIRNSQLVVSATSRWWPPGQVGKIFAIYPRDTADCRALLERLHGVLGDFEGPYVLTDRRYRDSLCLYYRYGEFSNESLIRSDGTSAAVLRGPNGEEWLDERTPAYRKPPWVPDLFPEPPAEPVSRDINGYVVTEALHHTGCGGIYLAERQSDQTKVILKESRPRTAFGADGASGQIRLRREFEALTAARGTGVAPEPIELFQVWEHLFLAEEFIDVGPLAMFLAARSPLAHGDLSPAALDLYRAQVRTVMANLRAAIAALHERGICYGDISMTNIMVEPETLAVRLVDFESSLPFAEWTGENPATQGYRPPPGSTAWTDPRRLDEFGVASIEMALISPRNVLRDLNPHALVRCVRHAAGLLRYPLGDLLERLDLPTPDDDPPPDLDVLVKDAVRFIENTLTPDRADRPFPTSPQMYVTNPWSVSYGVAGVLRGLHRLTGQVHSGLRDWMDRNAAGLDKLPAGLYFGLSGVGWTLLDVGETDRGRELIDRADRTAPDDLPATVLDGTVGIGLARLAAWQRVGDGDDLAAAARIGDHLIDTASDSGIGLWWPRPEAKKHPLGYAHGSSGVAAFLLYLHLATGDGRYFRTARRALDYELNQLTPRGGSGIGLPGHADHPLLEPYWERGSSGFGGVLARFCRVTGDERLRPTLDHLVSCTLQGTAVYPGLVNGMSGIVNFALDCRHLLGGDSYRDLAAGMAEGVLAMACPQPEGLAFPGHGLLRYSNDFASGSMGIALVLDRLRRGGPDFNYTLDELLPESPDA
ncbi:class III lanthionine synthetase LanKC [Actinocrispum wychmicini]|uniref:Protein kinase-like protein n=1 Tax=Actinocrispum wychmicini TaxID=1213861 RepID=A0A4R2JTH1_9PSEU|nr:class III lanthionine synthetase LanKC [Actinocrispum wychmicini]TCO62282.1 protein kinase-like protein [Actinocrispum wychmicini]